MSNVNNRVVVTGIGVLCPLGLDATAAWQGLVAGKSGIDYITLFNPESFETKFAGEVKGFEPTNYINRKDVRHMDRFAQLAVAASLQAAAEPVAPQRPIAGVVDQVFTDGRASGIPDRHKAILGTFAVGH